MPQNVPPQPIPLLYYYPSVSVHHATSLACVYEVHHVYNTHKHKTKPRKHLLNSECGKNKYTKSRGLVIHVPYTHTYSAHRYISHPYTLFLYFFFLFHIAILDTIDKKRHHKYGYRSNSQLYERIHEGSEREGISEAHSYICFDIPIYFF